ncbi:GNAT family N-acetyltransferase [Streptomyces sp. NPDC127068]|uniref:GNAT family N-acetyltransferase n=1 Tax=Streptomyces sp. NPDC127068 TaxID=3347127 RepID=UPI0036673D59
MTDEVIRLRTGGELLATADPLAALLVDTVHAGASLGFLVPLDHATAAAWWRGLAPAVDAGLHALWVTRDAEGVTGTIGVRFTDLPNGTHRGEVVKLMVHRRARGRGLGRVLLAAAERGATGAGVRLLHLDTETGSSAEGFYRAAGWERAGVIPDYATDPYGTPRPTTLFYKQTVDGRPGAIAGEAALAEPRDAPARR